MPFTPLMTKCLSNYYLIYAVIILFLHVLCPQKWYHFGLKLKVVFIDI